MEVSDKFAIAELIHAWGVYRTKVSGKSCERLSLPTDTFPCRGFAVHSSNSSNAAGPALARAALGRAITCSPIKLDKDHAVAETPVIIRVRHKFGSVEVDLTSSSRFLDRVERHANGWLIAERAAIYERDRLDPVEPSPEFDALFEAVETAHYPEQYRYMAFRIAHAEGRSLAPAIYRDGGPETADLYVRYSKWLAGGTA
jgi:hypothetical protein